MLCSISVMYKRIWLSIFMYSSRALCTSCSICSLRSTICNKISAQLENMHRILQEN